MGARRIGLGLLLILWVLGAPAFGASVPDAGAREMRATRFIYVWGAFQGQGDGSPERPFATISQAVQVAQEGDVIRVAGDPALVYRETLHLDKPVTLQGGYEASTWERDPSCTHTVIDGAGEGPVITLGPWGSSATEAALEGLTITNGGAIRGGGLLIVDAAPTVRGNRIVGNYALEAGGGIFVQDAAPLFMGNHMEGNRAYDLGGGGAWFENAEVRLYDNHVVGNHASSGDGGGLAVVGGSIRIERSQILANASQRGAGLWAMGDARVELLSSVIALNTTAQEGSGLAVQEAQAHLINVSVLGNTSAQGGAGLASLDASSLISATNSLLWGHGGLDVAGPNVSFRYSNLEQGLFPGQGNLSVEPALAGSIEALGFRLSPHSPLMDAGSNQVSIAYDWEGDWRFYDGKQDGEARADIGADEVAPNLGRSHHQIRWEESYPVPGGHVAYQITLANHGQMDAPRTTLTHTLPAGMRYRPGSWHADAGSAAVEGLRLTWQGTVRLGEPVTIGFIGDIDGWVEPGVFLADQAWLDYEAGEPLHMAGAFVVKRRHPAWLPLLGKGR